MFDPIISENTARTRRPLAVALSLAGQVVLVTLAVVAPLLHTETIAPGHLLRIISAPRRLGPVRVFTERPPAGVYQQRPGLRVFTDHVLRQPLQVPSAILPEMKAPSPDLLAGLSGPAIPGDPNGVPDGTGIDPAQVPKPDPPKLSPQPAVPAMRVPLRVGGNVQAAKIVHQVTPVYPPLARQARISGIVRIEAVISRSGTIESLQVMGGHPLLTQAALDAVRQWVYQPTQLNGQPVEVLTQIEVNFKLAD
jgi:periplasmic protein TonB